MQAKTEDTAILAAADSGTIDNLTKTEQNIIDALRDWRLAETDPTTFVELTALNSIGTFVRQYRCGGFDKEDAYAVMGWKTADEQAQAEAFYNAVVTISEAFPLFYHEAPARTGNEKRGTEDGG